MKSAVCSVGYYFSGDGAHRHSNGYYQITGRTDDVINVSGHRLGTAEIEDVMVSLQLLCLKYSGVLFIFYELCNEYYSYLRCCVPDAGTTPILEISQSALRTP